MRGVSSAISSRNRVPLSASSKRPFLSRIAPVNEPLDMAEKLAFKDAFRERSAIDWKKRLVAPRAFVMDRLGDQLLAGAAFAGNDDRIVGCRDIADQLENGNHAVVPADDSRKQPLFSQCLFELGEMRRIAYCEYRADHRSLVVLQRYAVDGELFPDAVNPDECRSIGAGFEGVALAGPAEDALFPAEPRVEQLMAIPPQDRILLHPGYLLRTAAEEENAAREVVDHNPLVDDSQRRFQKMRSG